MTLKKPLPLITAIAATLAISSAALASDQKVPAAASDAAKASAAPETRDLTNAEVRKIDKSTKKITLKHERIKNLDMPGMTMVFQVADASMLDKVQVGDKVKFAAKQEGNAYIVTDLVADK